MERALCAPSCLANLPPWNRPASLRCAIVLVWGHAHPRHFPGQKLRLGGDALGADPTYLLYLPYRSRGELRRIDLGPDCAGATLTNLAAGTELSLVFGIVSTLVRERHGGNCG